MGYTAIVLVGGVGSRLRPLTLRRPKPLIPLAGKPIVDRIIEWLRRNGFSRFILPAKYLGHMVEDHYRDSKDVVVKVVDSKDTADAVRLVSDLIGEDNNILISMGDVVCNADFRSFMKYHTEHDGVASIALKEVDDPLHYGVVLIDEKNRVTHFIEKPASIELYVLSLAFSRIPQRHSSNLVNTGFYIVGREVIDIIKKYPSLMDWGKHVFPYLVEQGYEIYGWIMSPTTYWEDLGRPENYYRVIHDLLDGKIYGFQPAGKLVDKGVYVGENTVIEGKVIPPVYLGDNVFVDKESIIGPYVSIEKNSIVKASKLSHSIVWENTEITGSEVIESIIMDNVKISGGCRIVSSIIGSQQVIPPETTLYKKIIEPQTT